MVSDSEDPVALLVDASIDLALARVPRRGIDPRIDADLFHVVRLYTEQKGLAVPKDSVYAELGEAVVSSDVADEFLNYRMPNDAQIDYAAIRAGLQVVAANVGIVIAPRPVLKVLSKKQVAVVEYIDDSVTETEIVLAWNKDNDTTEIQDFVGITKGRTKNTSRGEKVKKSAREKPLAKQARRAGGNNPKRRTQRSVSRRKRR